MGSNGGLIKYSGIKWKGEVHAFSIEDSLQVPLLAIKQRFVTSQKPAVEILFNHWMQET